MNKKGELTSGQIITIVILIISFVIILVFFYILNPKDEVTKESCRNSVMLRATAFGKSVKLQCKTQEVCVSGGSDCGLKGTDAQTIDVKTKEELYDQLSNLISDCWWQMGEGKVDYAPTGMGFSEAYCNICDTIRFDEKIRNNNDLNNIDMGEFYKYLADKKTASGDSMLYYLYNINSMNGVRDSILESTQGKLDILKEKVDLSNMGDYALVTSIKKEGYGPSLIGTGIGVAAGITIGVITMNPGAGMTAIPWIIKGVKIATAIGIPTSTNALGAIGWGTGLYVSSGNEQYQPPTLYPLNSEAIKQLNCKEYTSQAA